MTVPIEMEITNGSFREENPHTSWAISMENKRECLKDSEIITMNIHMYTFYQVNLIEVIDWLNRSYSALFFTH